MIGFEKAGGRHLSRTVSALALTVSVLAANPARGATAEAAAAADATPEEILVTARRRLEDPQDVPIALTVLGGVALEKQGISNLDQLKRVAPSLQVIGNNPRNTNINIRGLGANIGLANDGLESGVGVYIDDIYYARPGQALFDLVDLDRVELLRGPQGTLFGKNTTAGALSIYTRQPGFDPEFSGEASVGNYGYYQLRAAAGGAIAGDTVAGRLTVAQTSNHGFVRNTRLNKRVNDYNNFTIRGQLLLKPSENISLRLIGDYGKQHEDGYAAVATDLLTKRADGTVIPNGYAVRLARFPGYTPLPIDPSERQVDYDTASTVRMSQWGASAKLDWELPGHVLTVISAVRRWNWEPRNDADGTGLPVLTAAFIDTKQRQFSQEVRFASSGDQPLEYVVGAYYFYQQLKSSALTRYGSAAPLWILGGNSAVQQAALDGWGARGDSLLRTRSYAGFGQLTWHIDDRLSLTGGLRYTKETKKGSFMQYWDGGVDLTTLAPASAAVAAAIRGSFGAPNAYAARTKEGKFSGQVNLSYKFSDDVLGYATAARGFKSGGLTLTNVGPSVPKTVDPESSDHYEVGLKTQFFDRNLTLNAAAFWTQIDDYQASLYDPIRTTTYVSNVGKVRSRGFELEGRATPIEGLSTYGSVTYLDAKYRSYPNSPCPIELLPAPFCDLSGRRLPGAPKWTVAAGGEYGRAVTEGAEAYLGIDYSYRTAIYYAANLAESSRLDKSGLVNARLGVRSADGHWDVFVWARNLFDKDYYATRQAGAFNTGLITGILGDPRTIGATARLKL
jgi:iron complex outermembrane recepter protein